MPRRSTAKSEVKVSASDEADRAVREYLSTVGKPKAPGRRARPKPDFDAATKGIADPVAKLDAIKKERERVADLAAVDTLESDFVKFGKVWARIHGYGREDFAVLGVPKRVLDDTFGSTSGAKPTAPPARRAARTDAATIADAVIARSPGSWVSVASVMEEVGGSPATVRKVLDRLSAEGTLTYPIDDPNHAARGRAPKVWQRN